MEKTAAKNAPQGVYKRPSQAKEIWRRFKKSKGAVIGLIMLVMIALGVYQFISVGMPWAATEKLLQEGDYSPVNKRASKRTNMVAGVYWLGAVAIYLAISLPTHAWDSTWVLWPVAGVLFALGMVVCDFIKSKLYK